MKRLIARSILITLALTFLVGFVYLNIVHPDRILPVDIVFGGAAIFLGIGWCFAESGWYDG
jgi:hypothetical protein